MIGSIRDATFLQQVVAKNAQNNTEVLKKVSKDEKVEMTRTQEIKEALQKGEYKINIGGSAVKMARNLLGKE